MPTYPSTLPLPQADVSEHVFHVGRTMTTFDSGHTRQRLKESDYRYVLTLNYVFSTKELAEWQVWTNKYGYSSFENYRPVELWNGTWLPLSMRYISDAQIEALSQGYFKVTIMAESL